MAISIGRRGRVYAKKDSTYGETPTFAATDAVRHTNAIRTWDPFARVTSSEKKDTPGEATRFNRKQQAGLQALAFLMRPSGTLNTVPEFQDILEAAFGAFTNITDSATATGTPTVNTIDLGVGDVASAGYVVGDAVLVNIAAQPASKRNFVRWISGISGDQLTLEPDLPAAPVSGDTVKGCITFKPTTLLAISLGLAKFMPAGEDSWALRGTGIDSLGLAFDEAAEIVATVSGPAMDALTTGVSGMPTDPSTFTTVGGQPPSGLTGELMIDNTALLFRSAAINLANALAVRQSEYGVNAASQLYRRGRRGVSLTVDCWAETAGTLYNVAELGTNVQAHLQTGFTEGNIVAAYCPVVEFKPPTIDDPDEEVTWSYAGMALETSAGNDELSLAIA